MITNTITMTTPTDLGMASGFGMPVCGHAAFATPVTGQRSVDLRGTEIAARNRVVTKGQVALVAYVPGSTAWSPPIC
jgi:hypothetical protein